MVLSNASKAEQEATIQYISTVLENLSTCYAFLLGAYSMPSPELFEEKVRTQGASRLPRL